MNKISKAQLAELKKYNERASDFQALIDEVTEFCEGLREYAQDYFDERSEKWQESDKGQAYEGWIDSLECDAETLEELVEFLGNIPEAPQ